MSAAHTPGNWIAFQNEAQVANVSAALPQWSIGLDHKHPICRGASGDHYMMVGGVCSEADAKLMAASKALLELVYQYQSDLRYPPTPDSRERRLERIAAVLAKIEGAA